MSQGSLGYCVNTANNDIVEVLLLRKTGPQTADLELSVCKLGNHLTAGRTTKITISIEDSNDIRELSAHLNHLKTNNFAGVVQIKFNETQHYSMDQSVWHHIADALFAFSLCVDCAKLGL